MSLRCCILASAGHVDHGKSSLIRALTGVDPDRLPEEKKRGITIDLGFGHLRLVDPENPEQEILAGIIDVPGHEDLVKNMLAGMAHVDAALLVVAADDGWMPQTEEHVQILLYRGLTRAVVALTKVDLVADVSAAAEQVRHKLAGTLLADAPIVPVSSVTGAGLPELREVLARMLGMAPPTRDVGKPRLWIDRVFSPAGVGTVVTGTLAGGRLSKGQSVAVESARGEKLQAKIRTLQNHGCEIAEAVPGMRVAVNVPELTRSAGLRRGDVLTLPPLAPRVQTLEVVLHRLDRPGLEPPAVRSGTQVWVHIGSGVIAGRVRLLGASMLQPGDTCLARLRLAEPAPVFVGDRLVVRDGSARWTLAGGVVLEVHPRKVRESDLTPPAVGQAMELAPLVLRSVRSQQRVDRCELLRQSHFAEADIQAAVQRHVQTGAMVLCGEMLFSVPRWQALLAEATDFVRSFHAAHPERTGPELRDLQALLARKVKHADAVDQLIRELLQNVMVQDGTMIRLRTHRPAMPAYLASVAAQIRRQLAEHPFDPPSRKELAGDLRGRQALAYLIDTGEVAEICAEVVLSAEAYQRAVAAIEGHLRVQRSATVTELKSVVGSTRRIMVPLLELLDRQGVTRRVEDQRVLGHPVMEVSHETGTA